MWKIFLVLTGIGGAYMIGRRVWPAAAEALIGTTRRRGTALLRGAMPLTSFSWLTVMRCFLAMDSKVSPPPGW